MATKEAEVIKSLFSKLILQPVLPFPRAREKLDVTTKRGVYIIYDKRGRVMHVGCTPRARQGICQRLKNHLAGQSSFVQTYLKKARHKLRGGYEYRCLAVRNPRHMLLLEAYAIGALCPEHIGSGPTVAV